MFSKLGFWEEHGHFEGLPRGCLREKGAKKEGLRVPDLLVSALHFRTLCEILFQPKAWWPKPQ